MISVGYEVVMSESRVLLDAAAFLDSTHALRIDSACTDDIHDIRTATKACNWVAIAHSLCVSGEVRMDAVQLLCAALGYAKSSLDLIDDEHGAKS